MPPNNVIEERQLTNVEKEILKCWLNNGYPEN